MRTAVMPAQRACAVSAVQVRVHEDLDLVSIGQIGAVLDTALGLRPVRLVVDMAGCAFVDAAGISLLLDAHRRASQYDGRLLLRSVRPLVRRVLHFDPRRQVSRRRDADGT